VDDVQFYRAPEYSVLPSSEYDAVELEMANSPLMSGIEEEQSLLDPHSTSSASNAV
jgi:hypothetical protein